MPIVQIIVAPDAAPQIQKVGATVVQQIRNTLLRHLKPAPETIQIVVQSALLPPAGCATLCLVQHRASESRNAEVRLACAKDLHDELHAATGQSVRVRLIALDPHDIAAFDTPGDHA